MPPRHRDEGEVTADGAGQVDDRDNRTRSRCAAPDSERRRREAPGRPRRDRAGVKVREGGTGLNPQGVQKWRFGRVTRVGRKPVIVHPRFLPATKETPGIQGVVPFAERLVQLNVRLRANRQEGPASPHGDRHPHPRHLRWRQPGDRGHDREPRTRLPRRHRTRRGDHCPAQGPGCRRCNRPEQRADSQGACFGRCRQRGPDDPVCHHDG
jgi:hypothetical protein